MKNLLAPPMASLNFCKQRMTLVAATVAAGTSLAYGQTLTDVGPLNPVPAANDIFQLGTNGNTQLTAYNDGFNYFTDNSSPPGQTFTTGASAMMLTSVCIKTGCSPLDSGSGGLGPEQYELQLFVVSNSTATPIPNTSFYSSSSFGYTDGDWLQWTNLSAGTGTPVLLAANTTYAYSFRRVSRGYDGLAVASGNLYSGGEAVLIPNGGGTITYQSTHGYDAAFDVGLVTPPVNEPTNDNHIIYSEQVNLAYPNLNNGWQNWNYGSTLNFTNPSPVRPGESISISANMPGYSRIWFVNNNFDVRIYTNFTFWVNGGPNGGQVLQVSASTNSVQANSVNIGPLPANTWQQISVSLAAMGVAGATNLNNFWIINNSGNTQPVFYLSDISLTASAPPATVHLSVNALSSLETVDPRVLGINAADWDSYVNTPTTLSILTNMNNQALRWPGGSGADVYFMTNGNSLANTLNFIHVATNTHAQVYFTVNYGTGTPQQAATWVAYCNLTNHCGFKYWEVGNESGGTWETDDNTNAPWQPHDPWTYAMRFQQYYTAMKAVDPTILIGSSADVTEDGTANYTNHPVTNPRTHVTHNGWTPVMLYTMRTNGCICDFLIDHTYGPGNCDTADLTYNTVWTVNANNLRQMLVDYLGSENTNVQLDITENGSGGNDRELVSVVSGLFWADSLGQLLQTEFKSRLWWDLRNGQSDYTPSDNALYGWRKDASTGYFYGDLGIVAGLGNTANTRYPAYYAGELMKYFVGGGDKSVTTTSDYELLSAYGVRRMNGTLSLLVVNKSCYASINASINIGDFVPGASATAYSYGSVQDQAEEDNSSATAMDLATTNFPIAGTNFTVTFPPYTATVIQLPPAGFVTSFSATPASGFVPATVTFKDNSSGSITNWQWIFGDGNTLNTTTHVVSHIYTMSGSNTVTMVVSGPGGSATNSLSVTMVNPSGEQYEAAILADNPAAFYELNELNDPATGTAVACDYAGGNNGIYGKAVQNGYDNIAGPRISPDSATGFSGTNTAARFTVNTANSQITLPALNLDNDSATITVWLKPSGSQNSWAGIVYSRGGTTVAGLSYTATQSGGNYTLGYNWNNDPSVWGWNSGLVVPPNQWSLVALTVNPTNAIISVININGFASAAHAYTHVVQNFDGNTLIGDDSADGGNGGRGFNGVIDDVAIFRTALSSNQLTALFTAAYAPSASFTAAPITGFAPLAVTFTDTSTGDITNRHWIFGDSNTLDTTATSVPHTYNKAGTNTVTLAVSGPGGAGTEVIGNFIVATNALTPRISATAAGNSLVIMGIGTPAATYGLFSWTNLQVAPSGVTTGIFDPVTGVISNVITMDPTNPAMFFRLMSPYP